MTDLYRRVLCAVLAGLMLIILSNMSLAQHDQNCSIDECKARMDSLSPDGMHHQFAGFPMGVPIEVVHSGHGFALKEGESHLLRLNVETLLLLELTQIRDVLSSNKSLEEIRGDILAKDGKRTYRGSMMLDRSIYPLVDIQIAPLGNNSTSVKANVAGSSHLSAENETVILGRISVIIAPSDGGIVGKGDLEISSTEQAGNYSVLLDMTPAMHRRDMIRPGR